MATPSGKIDELVLVFLRKLDLALFIAPFSFYLFFIGRKMVSADKSVIEVIKGMGIILLGIVLLLIALYIRIHQWGS